MTVRFDTALRALIQWLTTHTDLLPSGDLAVVRDLRGQYALLPRARK